jgi:hypothetical protein
MQERCEERAGQGFDKLSPNGCGEEQQVHALPSHPTLKGVASGMSC